MSLNPILDEERDLVEINSVSAQTITDSVNDILSGISPSSVEEFV